MVCIRCGKEFMPGKDKRQDLCIECVYHLESEADKLGKELRMNQTQLD